MDRRSAREQSLPEPEADFLSTLHGDDLYLRCRDLYNAGWTLRAMAEAIRPPVSRATVHNWINKTVWAPTLAIHDTPPVPDPQLKTTKEYVRKTPTSPGIPPNHLLTIQELAPIARKFRSGMSPKHRAAIANDALTVLCQQLHEDDVPIQELADAAGVTYRAMAKRIDKT
jgi:hypothetical protein